MSRDPLTREELPDPGDPEGRPPEGHVGPTGPGTVVGSALLGLVLGWLVRPVSVRLDGTAPTVGWLPVLTLGFVAAVMGWVAWSTYRLIQRQRRFLEPHKAVNRLLLAKACAVTGALVAGAYLGYAVSWLGLTDTALARERVVHSLLAALAAALLVVGSLLLERACKVRS